MKTGGNTGIGFSGQWVFLLLSGGPANAASPNGGVKPPLHQTDPLLIFAVDNSKA